MDKVLADAASEVLTWVVPDALHGQRLDVVLVELSGFTRVRIQQLLADACITLDGAKANKLKRAQRVSAGQSYLAQIPPNEISSLQAEDIALHILFEDEHLLVVNKAAGMVVHPSHGHDSGTLVHALLHHCPDLPGINGVERPGIVHRLDKDTSGSLVVAKTEQAHHGLSALFANHDLRREYVAWCRGFPRWIDKHIDLPIGRHPQHRQKMAVNLHGKAAVTDARLEKRFDEHFCRMRLRLHTGRTHQIRVHLSHEGLPVLADSMYGRKFNPSKSMPDAARTAILSLERQALHAEVLAFIHPITKAEVCCEAPLPPALKALDQALSTLL
ncbi:MAG: RluA family pseudouridine synthase [Mariprofundaceae bacterium]|nr:RluA family pseudouridine synthase [Mariprofundaceae bacterium]